MHVPAHHGPSKPRGRFSTAVKVPRRSRRTSWEVLRSVHRGVQLVLRFRHLLPVRSTGSPAHVSALAGTSTRLVIRPVIRGPSGRIFPVSRPSLSCCLSAAGIRLLGTLSRQRGSAPLTIGLPPRLRVPAPARRTLARFTRFARMRPRPGRAPSIPRAQRCSPAVDESAAVACRLSAAGPCHPGTATQPGMCT